LPVRGRLDVRGPTDGDRSQRGEVERLVVEAAHDAARSDEELHGSLLTGATDQVAAWSVDEEPVERSLNLDELIGDAAAERLAVAERLRLDAREDLSRSGDQRVQLRLRSDRKLGEAVEKFFQIGYRRVAKDLRFAVRFARKPVGQMLDQPR
jgi:hypothetical protein